MSQDLLKRVRSAFLAGLLIAVPMGVTLWILAFLVGFLESAILLVPRPLQPEALLGMRLPGLGVMLALTLILALGFATQNYFGNRVLLAWEEILGRVPVLSSVYLGVKQAIQAALVEERGTIQSVVLVEWPRKGIYSLGFYTGTSLAAEPGGPRLLNVFLPSTPNPTTGFYFMVREDEVVHTELTVEEAAKLLMSAGIVSPDGTRLIDLGRKGIPLSGDHPDPLVTSVHTE